MAKGENIFKRKDGRWEARYIKGRDISGKIHYGYCYGKSYKEAKEKVTQRKAAAMEGKSSAKGSNRKLDVYCDEWLNNKKSQIKESTYIKYETTLSVHIKPNLGNFEPAAVTDELAERFRDELLYKKNLSPKTVKDILVVLRSVLKYAARMESRGVPELAIGYPRDIKKEMRILSTEEQKTLINYLLEDLDECKFGILLALYTGMRIGEVCALKWDNISADEEMIRVASTMQRLKSLEENDDKKTKILIDTPKSSRSARFIPMSRTVIELSEELRPVCQDVYVLTGTKKHMEPRTLQYRLKRYAENCGLEGVHFHTLRHTFATRCVEVGFELKSLSEILGHATTTITLDRYVHSSIQLKKDNIKKLEAIGM